MAALTQYGRIFRKTCEASGFVPQLSLILGPCAGGAVYCPALTDLIIMTRENSNMFVTGPDVVKASTGETISMADLGGGEVHNRCPAWPTTSARTNPTHRLCAHRARLPAVQQRKQAAVYAYAVTRAERETAKRLATIVPTNERQPYDMLEVIRCIVDYGEFVQVQELFGASALVASPASTASRLASWRTSRTCSPASWTSTRPRKSPDSYACATRSTCRGHPRGCARLQARLRPGTRRHHRRGAKVIYAYANAQVPMVTVVLRKAFGGAYIVMGSKAIGADLNFARFRHRR